MNVGVDDRLVFLKRNTEMICCFSLEQSMKRELQPRGVDREEVIGKREFQPASA
jgi:hypothetical protein